MIFASAAAAGNIAWGVNGHPFNAYPGIPFERQLDDAKALGLTDYRVNVTSIEQVSGLKHLVALAQARGMTVLPVLTPPFDDKATPEVLGARATAFARAVVGAFPPGRIKVWELGNEMENHAIIQPCELRDDGTQYPCEWGPAGGTVASDYFGPRWRQVSAVLKALSETTQAIDPAARRAMGTAGWGHTGAFERMVADGIGWEISVWHQYAPDNGWAYEKLAALGKPIWITELNNGGGSTDGEDAQARGLAALMKEIAGLAARYRIEAVHLYELYDESYWTGYESVMGLYRLDKIGTRWQAGVAKAAAAAVRATAASESGAFTAP